MPILIDWNLPLTTEHVLRAQGADPEIIRSRRPSLIKTADWALREGLPLLNPRVLFQQYSVKSLAHERLEIYDELTNKNQHYLSGPLIAQHLGPAEKIIVMICTIGKDLEEIASELMSTEPLRGFALDSVGSAASEMLAIQACNYFEAEALTDGLQTTLPLNPGMIGWSVRDGQPQIFNLLDSREINVSLNADCMMSPQKSLSLVLGIGPNAATSGQVCDYCSLNGICKYQNHYAKQA